MKFDSGIGGAVLAVLYIMGIVLAKGFWSTFFAIIMPLWSLYLSVEFGLQYFGVL